MKMVDLNKTPMAPFTSADIDEMIADFKAHEASWYGGERGKNYHWQNDVRYFIAFIERLRAREASARVCDECAGKRMVFEADPRHDDIIWCPECGGTGIEYDG